MNKKIVLMRYGSEPVMVIKDYGRMYRNARRQLLRHANTDDFDVPSIEPMQQTGNPVEDQKARNKADIGSITDITGQNPTEITGEQKDKLRKQFSDAIKSKQPKINYYSK